MPAAPVNGTLAEKTGVKTAADPAELSLLKQAGALNEAVAVNLREVVDQGQRGQAPRLTHDEVAEARLHYDKFVGGMCYRRASRQKTNSAASPTSSPTV